MTNTKYEFTNNWFDATAKPTWGELLPNFAPKRILEIGSYEGASICWLIETLGQTQSLEICSIDTWDGGIEHKTGGFAESKMSAVEARFQSNINLALEKAPHPVQITVEKNLSDIACAKLLAEGKRNYFDFIYIDGSHQAPDVLLDATLCFKLLQVGGLMSFDDYLWGEPLPGGRDPLRCPKMAIDAFININIRKLNVLPLPANQVYLIKTTD